MRFHGNKGYGVGVEVELQLLDAKTLDLADRILPLMDGFPGSVRVKPDLIQSCVEICTTPCRDSMEAVGQLVDLLDPLQEHAEALGLALAGAGTHAFGQRLALITPLPRYQRMSREHGYMSHHQITFAMHVHVGMPSGDTAIHVMNRLSPCLPALLALAANSPFWRGYDTGYACYRQRILAASRMYGRPQRFDDWKAFSTFFDAAVSTGTIEIIKDVHWDIRPHPDFGTLELRVMDTPSCIAKMAGLTAFVRCLMACLAESLHGDPDSRLPPSLPDWMETENYYRASHLGLDARLISDASGGAQSIRNRMDQLLDLIRPTAQTLGERMPLGLLEQRLLREPGYIRQRELDWQQSSHYDVMDGLRQDLLERPAEVTGELCPDVANSEHDSTEGAGIQA